MLMRATDTLSDSDHAQLERLLVKLLKSILANQQDAYHVCRLCEHAVCRGDACPVERWAVPVGPTVGDPFCHSAVAAR